MLLRSPGASDYHTRLGRGGGGVPEGRQLFPGPQIIFARIYGEAGVKRVYTVAPDTVVDTTLEGPVINSQRESDNTSALPPGDTPSEGSHPR